MKENLSGIYRTHWGWKSKSYEALAVIFHSSDNAIIGLEICTDSDKTNGGTYLLKGEVTKTKITGKWWKLNNSQRGGFSLRINSIRKQWQGGYNISIKSKEYPYVYTFNYIRKIK